MSRKKMIFLKILVRMEGTAPNSYAPTLGGVEIHCSSVYNHSHQKRSKSLLENNIANERQKKQVQQFFGNVIINTLMT